MRLNLKMREENENIRLIWNWHEGIEKVFVNKKLFTLQEYKKLGGYFFAKTPGNFTYRIEPTEDNLCEFEENEISFTNKTEILFFFREQKNFLRANELNFSSQNFLHANELILFSKNKIPRDVICYEKINSGVLYFFEEELEAGIPLARIIHSEEKIRVFVDDDKKDLYTLKEQPHGTFQTKKNRA
ncbi:MAG: hypothetical protein FWD19_02990 [Defluviitaleaceae bacterium]|nr:hypothetical protein [Defluviitaleaceae bacterium]